MKTEAFTRNVGKVFRSQSWYQRTLFSVNAGEATTSNHKYDCIQVFTVGGPTPAVAETTSERQL